MEITANNLTFKTLKKTIVDGVSFCCQTDKNTAFVGPEGSGKKALLLMIGGFLKPTSGSVYCNGENISKNLSAHRAKIGLGEIANINPLFEDLTVRENLRFCMEIKGMKPADAQKQAEETLRNFQLNAYADTPVAECDPIARALASAACACAHNPEIIILDEPTSKLTSLQAKLFWQILSTALKQEIVLFSTKNYEEAAANAGNIIDMETIKENKFCPGNLTHIPVSAETNAMSNKIAGGAINNSTI